jgi:phage FluMu protein Com
MNNPKESFTHLCLQLLTNLSKFTVSGGNYLLNMRCPACKGNNVKQILYGMPDFENFDFEKYEVGGCTDMDEGPTHRCVDCSKLLTLDNMNASNKII